MSAYSFRAEGGPYYPDAFVTNDDPEDFYSGERVCAPTLQSGGNPVRRIYLALAGAVAFGLALQHTSLLASLTPLFEAASRVVEQALATQPPAPAITTNAATDQGNASTPSNPPPRATEADVPATPPATTSAPAEPQPLDQALALPPVTAVEEPPLAAELRETPAAKPVDAKADPYQKRAEAAGLHPDISHALLERLSPQDYRNAAIAIETAIANTSDTDVFVFPAKRKPQLAMFEVHFVAGANPDCRRYVVRIAKDGWATTARPMEKCGQAPLRHHA